MFANRKNFLRSNPILMHIRWDGLEL